MNTKARHFMGLACFCIFLFPWVLYAAPKNTQDRTGQVLFKNNRADSGDYPFILEAKLVTEKSNELVFDITYFMSDTIADNYGISVYPNNSSYGYTPNTLKPGINTQKVIVSFMPQIEGQTTSHSDKMYFQINRFINCVNGCNCKDMGIVFDRTFAFEKAWSH